jgi:hypothetical protein
VEGTFVNQPPQAPTTASELRQQPHSPQPHRLRALAGEASTRTTPRRLCVTVDHSFSGTTPRCHGACKDSVHAAQQGGQSGTPRVADTTRPAQRVIASGHLPDAPASKPNKAAVDADAPAVTQITSAGISCMRPSDPAHRRTKRLQFKYLPDE